MKVYTHVICDYRGTCFFFYNNFACYTCTAQIIFVQLQVIKPKRGVYKSHAMYSLLVKCFWFQ